MDEIKLDIEKQITKTNRAFTNFRGRLYYDDLLDNEIESLEIPLRKVTKQFKGYKIISIISSLFLITISLFSFFDIITIGNINHIGPLIIITLSCMTTTFTFYKLKVNLENKIYLLGLIGKIEKIS